MNRSDSIQAIAPALLAVQGLEATKSAINAHLRNRYADLASVWDAVREPLRAAGLLVVQAPSTVDGGVNVVTTIIHVASCEWIASSLTVPVAKLDAHGVGSGITYARRYALTAMLGVCPEDDDGEGAVRPQGGAPRAAQPAPARPPVAGGGDVAKMVARIDQGSLGDLPAIAKEIQDGVKGGVFGPEDRARLLGAYNARRAALSEREPGSDG